MIRIKTHYWAKPIPQREFDWEAFDEETYDMDEPLGHGPTELAAIADLVEKLQMRKGEI